jgi:peptidoglycan/LPS O-acetylase OafA/YrhL
MIRNNIFYKITVENNRKIQNSRFASLRLQGWLVFIALAIALSLPGSGSWHGVLALTCAWIIFPALILAGAQATTGPRFLLVCTNLGAASYAFYILQVPIIELIRLFFGYLVGMPLSALGWMGVALVVAVVYISALVADALFDIPARRWLRARVQHLARAAGAYTRPPV